MLGGQLLEERQVRRRELVERGQPEHRLDLALEHHREARPCCAAARWKSAEPTGTVSAGTSVDQDAALVDARTGRRSPSPTAKSRRIAVRGASA